MPRARLNCGSILKSTLDAARSDFHVRVVLFSEKMEIVFTVLILLLAVALSGVGLSLLPFKFRCR